jgi:hypothetical protein
VLVSTLHRVNSLLIHKRQQLSNGKRDINWVLAKRKKGFSKIDEELCLLLINTFNYHPHVIVSPNAKGTLLIKNGDREKVAMRKY